MGLSGLLLVGFIVTHLLGNLLLYKSDGTSFNAYAEKLHSLGGLLIAAEIGLVALFATHAFTGIRLSLSAKSAKGVKPALSRSKGGESKWGLSANHMVWSGSFLLLFLVLHVFHFKFGPGIAEGYVTTLPGAASEEVRDLHRHVVEQFKNPMIMIAYMVSMLFLGLHLRHGIWSGLQSLGLTRENNSKTLYFIGGGLSLLFTLGFILIPVIIFLRGV